MRRKIVLIRYQHLKMVRENIHGFFAGIVTTILILYGPPYI